MTLQKARALTAEYRNKAQEGIDPRPLRLNGKQAQRKQERERTAASASGTLYRDVVAQFIELYAKPRQRSWDDTQPVLVKNCAIWLDRDIKTITEGDAQALIDSYAAEGHGPKAEVTLAWLRKLWRWAFKRKFITAPIMDTVEVEYEKKARDRRYSEDEIAAIWEAADKLDPIEGGYVKLVLLLAPRKRELALMRRSDLDNAESPTLWTTPFEHTKARKKTSTTRQRVYLTPLPRLAQRILMGLINGDGDRVFPTLPIYSTAAGRQWFDSNRLIKRLTKHGAPQDFTFHACRHTLATWLHERGHSDWECGLVLNHSSTGSVTGAHYLHSTALELKAKPLTKWAEHVEGLTQPGTFNAPR